MHEGDIHFWAVTRTNEKNNVMVFIDGFWWVVREDEIIKEYVFEMIEEQNEERWEI